MLAVMSAVAFAGYLFRPMGDSYRASSVSLSVPSVATEHPNEFREVPTLGYTGSRTSGLEEGTARASPGHDGTRRGRAGRGHGARAARQVIRGREDARVQRRTGTRRAIGAGYLNRRYELPENRLRVNRPNPQQAHVDSGALPITTYGRVQTHLRAGTRNRAPIPDFETGNRMRSDAGTWTTSVLPERAAVLSTRENVSDAMDKGTPATWARMQVTGNRVNPKRLDHLNALEAHPAPVGDGGLEAIQFGARTGAKVREPLGVKTCVQRVPNSEFVTSVDRVEDQEHTHLFENRTFDAVMPGGEYPQTRDAVEDAFQIGRFPLLDRSQLTAVAVGAPDMAQYNEERKERGRGTGSGSCG
eukprot:jgi/Mesvir1/22490/Mv04297-RA.1